MRILVCLLTASILFALTPAGAEAFKYTHKLYVSGELTDNWTEVDPDDCGYNGPGSVNVKFKTTRPIKVRLMRDRVGSRPRTKGSGLWVLAVPGGGGHTHAPDVKVDATITTTDSRVPIPVAPNIDCNPIDTRGCGTKKISPALVSVAGYDPKHLYSSDTLGQFRDTTDCETGILTSWNFPYAQSGGDNRFGDFIFKMPSAKSAFKKKTITLTRSNRKTSTAKRSELRPAVVTDDVSRKFVIELKRLK
jgi:hypothetical protein